MDTIKEVKDMFFNEYAPIIRDLETFASKNFNIYSLWVTEYGNICLDKLEDDFEFVEMITECGYLHEYNVPCISIDFNLKLEENNPQLADALQKEFNIEYYDDNWYRKEFFGAEDIRDFYNRISAFVKENTSYGVASAKMVNGKKSACGIVAKGFSSANEAFFEGIDIAVEHMKSFSDIHYDLITDKSKGEIKLINAKDDINYVLNVVKI